jgi:hypothetical protein
MAIKKKLKHISIEDIKKPPRNSISHAGHFTGKPKKATNLNGGK